MLQVICLNGPSTWAACSRWCVICCMRKRVYTTIPSIARKASSIITQPVCYYGFPSWPPITWRNSVIGPVIGINCCKRVWWPIVLCADGEVKEMKQHHSHLYIQDSQPGWALTVIHGQTIQYLDLYLTLIHGQTIQYLDLDLTVIHGQTIECLDVNLFVTIQ